MCGSKRKKQTKNVKLQRIFVCTYNSQGFAQTPETFERLHDRETVTFRNSVTIILVN